MAKNPTGSLQRIMASTGRLRAPPPTTVEEAGVTMAKNPAGDLRRMMASVGRLRTPAPTDGGGGEGEWRPLYRRLSALGGGRAAEGRVAATMEGWLREGRLVTAKTLVTYVRELRKYKRYHHAMELIDWMEKQGFYMTGSTHAIRLDLVSKVKGIGLAESYFSGLPAVAKNQLTYGALFSNYCQMKMADKASALYEKMKEMDFASSTLVVNNLMSLYMKLDQPEKVPAYFQEMKDKNICPDNHTYSMLMTCYARLNDLESVERIRNEMEGGEVAVEWGTYSNLASIYLSAGLIQKAESALKKLKVLIPKNDRLPFHCLISLYASAGNLEEVNRVWELFKGKFVKMTNMNYIVMLQALNKLDNIAALQKCFQEWESSCVSYDMRLANVMIGAFLRKGMVEEAKSLCEKAKKKGVRPDFRTFELFMNYPLTSQDMNLALKLLVDATASFNSDKWRPDKEKLNALLKYFEEKGDVDGAEAVCECLKMLNILNIEAYGYLLRTYLSAGKSASPIYQRIKADGIEMSSEIEKLLETVSTSA